MESFHEFFVFQFALVKPGIKVLNGWRWGVEWEVEVGGGGGRWRVEREVEVGGGGEGEKKGRDRGGERAKEIIDILTRDYTTSVPYRG